jgi:hypothetical protein
VYHSYGGPRLAFSEEEVGVNIMEIKLRFRYRHSLLLSTHYQAAILPYIDFHSVCNPRTLHSGRYSLEIYVCEVRKWSDKKWTLNRVNICLPLFVNALQGKCALLIDLKCTYYTILL